VHARAAPIYFFSFQAFQVSSACANLGVSHFSISGGLLIKKMPMPRFQLYFFGPKPRFRFCELLWFWEWRRFLNCHPTKTLPSRKSEVKSLVGHCQIRVVRWGGPLLGCLILRATGQRPPPGDKNIFSSLKGAFRTVSGRNLAISLATHF
jgi:hypothetical protein